MEKVYCSSANVELRPQSAKPANFVDRFRAVLNSCTNDATFPKRTSNYRWGSESSLLGKPSSNITAENPYNCLFSEVPLRRSVQVQTDIKLTCNVEVQTETLMDLPKTSEELSVESPVSVFAEELGTDIIYEAVTKSIEMDECYDNIDTPSDERLNTPSDRFSHACPCPPVCETNVDVCSNPDEVSASCQQLDKSEELQKLEEEIILNLLNYSPDVDEENDLLNSLLPSSRTMTPPFPLEGGSGSMRVPLSSSANPEATTAPPHAGLEAIDATFALQSVAGTANNSELGTCGKASTDPGGISVSGEPSEQIMMNSVEDHLIHNSLEEADGQVISKDTCTMQNEANCTPPPPPPPPPPPLPPSGYVYRIPETKSPNQSTQSINLDNRPSVGKDKAAMSLVMEELLEKVNNRQQRANGVENNEVNCPVWNKDPYNAPPEMQNADHYALMNKESDAYNYSPNQQRFYPQEDSNQNGPPNYTSYYNSHPQDAVSTEIPDFYLNKNLTRDESSNGDFIPKEAVLIRQNVIPDGDVIHTDSYYALPVQEVTSTSKSVEAPKKYDGIGPTESGIPVSLRSGVKEEYASDWYKSMFKSLHKVSKEEEYRARMNPSSYDIRNGNLSMIQTNQRTGSDEYIGNNSSKSFISNSQRINPDLEPKYNFSSERETERSAPQQQQIFRKSEDKISSDGYESDSSAKKAEQKELDSKQQSELYREVLLGGEIPIKGLGMPAPQKPSAPVIGPPPPLQMCQNSYVHVFKRPEQQPPEDSLSCRSQDRVENSEQNYLQQNGTKNSQRSQGQNVETLKSSISPKDNIIAKVLYNFTSQNEREINLKKGQTVRILRQLDKNWYEGEFQKVSGIFPVSYVEIIPPEHISAKPKITEGQACAKYDFNRQTSVELSLKKGEDVILLRKVDDNWYEGRSGNNTGIFPVSYVTVIKEPKQEDSVDQKNNESSRLNDETSNKNIQQHDQPSSIVNQKVIEQKQNFITVDPAQYQVLYAYSPRNHDELELVEGDKVYVEKICDDGWFVGTCMRTGQFGTFPGNYVEKI